MEFVSGDGATALVSSGNKMEFAPLPKLEPGAKAEWRVNAKALVPSDHRFTVIMTAICVSVRLWKPKRLLCTSKLLFCLKNFVSQTV
jgi:hypothetical protein